MNSHITKLLEIFGGFSFESLETDTGPMYLLKAGKYRFTAKLQDRAVPDLLENMAYGIVTKFRSDQIGNN